MRFEVTSPKGGTIAGQGAIGLSISELTKDEDIRDLGDIAALILKQNGIASLGAFARDERTEAHKKTLEFVRAQGEELESWPARVYDALGVPQDNGRDVFDEIRWTRERAEKYEEIVVALSNALTQAEIKNLLKGDGKSYRLVPRD